ncbi:hypothetical protein QYF36_008435 [Acer negundo]|nr:hypothetical protein QYF36_008435 [Acer negundo]
MVSQARNQGKAGGDSGAKLIRGKRDFVDTLVDVSIVGGSGYGDKKVRRSWVASGGSSAVERVANAISRNHYVHEGGLIELNSVVDWCKNYLVECKAAIGGSVVSNSGGSAGIVRTQ